jgi:Protein of unknown function (DUF3102)
MRDTKGHTKKETEWLPLPARLVIIGAWLSEAKARLNHGQWLPWLKTEFGGAERTAQNFMAVYQASKSIDFADLEIEVSALYLIAAPKTPESVRAEVIRRASQGEPMTWAKAVDVLHQYKQTCMGPPPAGARQLPASNHRLIPPPARQTCPGLSPRRCRARQAAFLAAFRVMPLVAKAARAAQISRRRHYHWLAADPEYRRVFEETAQLVYGQIHDEAVTRAVEGWLEPVFYQGRPCGVVRRYSDSLLMLLLKLKMPEKYGNP